MVGSAISLPGCIGSSTCVKPAAGRLGLYPQRGRFGSERAGACDDSRSELIVKYNH